MTQISDRHFTSLKIDQKKYQTLFVDFANLSSFGITLNGSIAAVGRVTGSSQDASFVPDHASSHYQDLKPTTYYLKPTIYHHFDSFVSFTSE